MPARVLLSATAALAATHSVAASTTTLAELYVSATNVDQHSYIDLDQQDLEACQTTYTGYDSWEDCCRDVYENGANSMKSTGVYRTIQGFSTSASAWAPSGSKFTAPNNWTLATTFNDYWGRWDWGDSFVQDALNGSTGIWADISLYSQGSSDFIAMQQQCVKKGANYMNTLFYALYEYYCAYDGVTYDKYTAVEATYDYVHKWDEGIAFWTGSDETGTGVTASPYVLAEYRAGSFDTDYATMANGGSSQVNFNIFGASQAGRNALDGFDNKTSAGTVVEFAYKCIEKQAFIPTMQGCILYAYKTADCGGVSCGKAWAEMYTFCAAFIPILDKVNSTAAEVVMDAASLDGASLPTMQSFSRVKEAIYGNLNVMGYRCKDVNPCTYCGDSDVSQYCNDDDSVIDYCSMAWPIDETSDSSGSNDSSSDDNTTGIVLTIIGVVLCILGMAMMYKGFSFGKSTPPSSVGSTEVAKPKYAATAGGDSDV